MRDGALRRAVKRAALGLHDARLSIHRSQADIRYDLGGECGRCATCCEAPGIQVSHLTWYFPFARRTFVWWHRVVNGFRLVETRRGDRALMFTCTHFDPDEHACDSYDSRPGMCRDYPRLLLEHANPEFFDACGYRALPRNRNQLVQILHDQNLDEAQIRKISKELDLDD